MIEIPLRGRDGSLRATAFVDDEDWSFAQVAWFFQHGYARREVGGRANRAVHYLHRDVLGLRGGDGRQVDHINGDRLDDRKANLRLISHRDNGQNIVRSYGTSSYRGVSWDDERGKWAAYAKLAGRKHHLGRFDDELDAAHAASEFRLAHMPFTNEARTAA